MDIYNTKILVFGNGMMQIRRYKEPVIANLLTDEDKDTRKEIREREREKRKRADADLKRRNPFLDEGERMSVEVLPEDEIVRLTLEELEERQKLSVRASMSRTINKLYEYARSGDWEWFLTFTFADNNVDRYNYDHCCRVLRKWCNNTKTRYCPDMRYLIVPEQHQNGAWHYHGLFSGIDNLKMTVATNNKKDSPYFGDKLRVSYPHGAYIYNLPSFGFGYTTATQIQDTYKAGNYILKYVTKDLVMDTKYRNRYFCSRGLKRATGYREIMQDDDFVLFLSDLERDGYMVNYRKKAVVDTPGYSNEVEYLELATSSNLCSKNSTTFCE